MTRRISVDAWMYRRVLVEAITNLESLIGATEGTPHANLADAELLAYCRAQLERTGGPGPMERALREARSVPLHELPMNDRLVIGGLEYAAAREAAEQENDR